MFAGITTLAGITYHLPCVSRWVCDAALWWQTLMYSPHLVPPYHPLPFSYSLQCHIKWRGPIAFLFPMCSASPLLPVSHALLYETHKTSVQTKNSRWWRKPWPSTKEVIWLSRATNSMTFSIIFLAMSLSWGYLKILPRCLWPYCLSELTVFIRVMCNIKFLSNFGLGHPLLYLDHQNHPNSIYLILFYYIPMHISLTRGNQRLLLIDI